MKQFFLARRLMKCCSIWVLICTFMIVSCQDHRLPQLNCNLDVDLLKSSKVSGHVAFRQGIQFLFTIYSDTLIQGLEPDTNYVLQRAVDTN